MAAPGARARVARGVGRGEEVLPAEVQVRARVFAMERVRQFDATESCRDRGVVNLPQPGDAGSERGDERVRDDGDAILEALAVANHQRSRRQVDILDAHSQRFEQAKPAAVEQGGDGPIRTVQLAKHSAHLLASEDYRKPLGASCARDVPEPGEVYTEDALVEEEDGGERLRLGGRGDVARGGEVREEGLYVGTTQCLRVLAAVELDESDDPSDILLLRSIAVVALADFGADVIEELWFRSMLHNQTAAFDDMRRPWSI